MLHAACARQNAVADTGICAAGLCVADGNPVCAKGPAQRARAERLVHIALDLRIQASGRRCRLKSVETIA